MTGKNNNNKFSFLITFAPKKKLLGAKLKKAMDNYYGCIPRTTKNIKSISLLDLDLKDIDNGTKRYNVGTKIFKVFNDVQYKGTVTGYDHRKCIIYFMRMVIWIISTTIK